MAIKKLHQTAYTCFDADTLIPFVYCGFFIDTEESYKTIITAYGV